MLDQMPTYPCTHDWSTLKARAEALFAAAGTTLTPLREAVIAELFAAGKPLGAYDLAEQLNRRNGGHVAINSVYRILSRCLEVGLVRRVESRHAYIVLHEDDADAAMFLLCDQCGTVTVVADARVDTAVAERAAALGFQTTSHGVEIAGTCRDCSPAGKGAPQ